MEPQYLARRPQSNAGFDAAMTQIGGFPRCRYLFLQGSRRLTTGCPKATHTSDPMRGPNLACAAGTKTRRDRCQRASKLWQLWALSFLSQLAHATSQFKKNSLLWIQNPYPKNQHTQVNSNKPVAGRAHVASVLIPTSAQEGWA